MVNKAALVKAVKMIGPEHAQFLYKLAQQQDKIENQWVAEASRLHKKIVRVIIKNLQESGKADFPDHLVFEFLLAHYFRVVGTAAESAEKELEVIVDKTHLAKPKIPKSMRELRIIYDTWKKSGRLPKGIRDMGETIKKNYLDKTQSVWQKHSEDFRAGDDFTQENVLRKVEKAADVSESRAKTIVRTETTNYYNETRREIYDQSDAITHYLFLAIRDQGTTKWCTDRKVNGKRGRHGLVYKKDDPLTAQETPACHWNCRSEMVPLTPFNPRHRKLIADESVQRRNHKCAPLPEGWS